MEADQIEKTADIISKKLGLMVDKVLPVLEQMKEEIVHYNVSLAIVTGTVSLLLLGLFIWLMFIKAPTCDNKAPYMDMADRSVCYVAAAVTGIAAAFILCFFAGYLADCFRPTVLLLQQLK